MGQFTATATTINAGLGSVKEGTIEIGESGRSRKNVVVRMDRLPTEGHLVRIDTMRVYTRGAVGSIVTLVGGATIIAEGRKAWGDAGGLGSGPDAIIHMPPGSVAVVVFSGGRGKGQGTRIISVPPNGAEPRIFDVGEDGDAKLKPGPLASAALYRALSGLAPEVAPKTRAALAALAADNGPTAALG